ncbi:MAG: metallophosphoesterase family protein [Candidatus Odinarchaeota archaeon]
MKVAVISDVHSNVFALQTALDFIEGKVDRIIFAGDIVGYGPQPQEAVKMLQELNLPSYQVVGNHDLGVRFSYSDLVKKPRIDDFKILRQFRFRDAASLMLDRNAKDINQDTQEFLESLMPKIAFTIGQEKFYMTHGAPSTKSEDNICKYVKPPPYNDRETIMNRYVDCDKKARSANIIINGHTHQRMLVALDENDHFSLIESKISSKAPDFPCKFEMKGKRFILNPGSIGQSRDGTGNASFSVIDLEEHFIEFHDLDYPRKAFYKLVREKCVPDLYGEKFWAIKF